jgi:hypothetical protein
MPPDSLSATLLGLARGTVSVDDAQSALRFRADFSFDTNPAWIEWRKPLDPTLSVPIRIRDVREALKRFLAGRWKARDLHLWAQFLELVGSYKFPNKETIDDDYYDRAWGVINDLSTPEIHGVATEEFARARLAALEGYGPD